VIGDRGELGLVRDQDDLREFRLLQQLPQSGDLFGGEPFGRLVQDDRRQLEVTERTDDLTKRQTEREGEGRPLAAAERLGRGPRPVDLHRRREIRIRPGQEGRVLDQEREVSGEPMIELDTGLGEETPLEREH
jgi:hypothetical protein